MQIISIFSYKLSILCNIEYLTEVFISIGTLIVKLIKIKFDVNKIHRKM